MNDRAVAVLEQYDFVVNNTRKGRGAMIAETDKGMIGLWEYVGKTERLFLCKDVCDRVEASGFCNIDNLIPNKEGKLFVTDLDGKNYVVKRYVDGRECDVTDGRECRYIVGEIAKMHRIMEFGEVLGLKRTKETDPEMEKEVEKAAEKETEKMEREPVIRDFSKREAELNRVRSFIRKQSKKGEFELAFLKQYAYFDDLAKEADRFLDGACLERLSDMVAQKGMYCHGECNQHNILIGVSKIAATHFEKCCMDIQIRDLYLFLRKILEKNNWSCALGFSILEEYEKNKPLSVDEKRYLYARLLYPERFWKIANAYLNKRKSLPPRRQLEKLNALIAIEGARMDFLKQLEQNLL